MADVAKYISDKPIQNAEDINPNLRIYDDGELSIYYAPFDSINSEARVVIVGLTPGLSQARVSYQKYREAIKPGKSHSEDARLAKGTASFAGSMRTNLISMLDGIGLHETLGMRSSEQLFGSHAHLLHATSALRYPVFK